MSVVSGALVVALGLGALLRKEFGPFCLWLAPRLVRWAAGRLPAPWNEIRQEEWLETLNSMKDMRLLRLLWALGFCLASVRLQPSRRASKTLIATSGEARQPSYEEVWLALMRLSPRLQLLLILRFGDCLTLEEMAQQLAVPSQVLRMQVGRSLTQLRQELDFGLS